MTPAELDRLLALADAATPGPWRVIEDAEYVTVQGPSPDDEIAVLGTPNTVTQADAAFIAAANPDTIRALVAEAKSASGEAAAHEFVESIAVREPLDVEGLAAAAYEDRPPTGRRPVPWTPVLRREWTAWARRMAAALEPKP